ncbi:hypothetical protein JOE09_005150 [Pantoea coffeiphila]|nr:hypothetical protein [Pantoea coffeiphila]
MSVYTKIAVPMFCVAFAMFYLARKKRDKNFLIPGLALLLAGFVNLLLGLTLG